MSKSLIKISYRQVIDAASTGNLERNILTVSYNEFLLKSQAYNPDSKYKTFTEMKAADGRANSLHYKCGFAVGNFINSLNNTIPGLKDTLGKNLLFETHQFEVIESDITDKSKHTIAIVYFTATLTLYEKFGDFLLLAYGDMVSEKNKEETPTYLLQVQPCFSICSYKPFTADFFLMP